MYFFYIFWDFSTSNTSCYLTALAVSCIACVEVMTMPVEMQLIETVADWLQKFYNLIVIKKVKFDVCERCHTADVARNSCPLISVEIFLFEQRWMLDLV